MGTNEALSEKGFLREDGRPFELHHLITCRMFAKIVWVDKILLKVEIDFDAARLHEILHANDSYFYDICPGESVVARWFKEFAMEVC